MGNLSYKKNNQAIDAPGKGIATAFETIDRLRKVFEQPDLDDILSQLMAHTGKKSFLVFRDHKYTTVATKNIAFFYVKNESSVIKSFNQQEYSVNYSLEQLQQLLTPEHFYRLNRQYLVNFYAIKEVEHYFARKLLVRLGIPAPDKLLVPKEKTSSFLQWLENR